MRAADPLRAQVLFAIDYHAFGALIAETWCAPVAAARPCAPLMPYIRTPLPVRPAPIVPVQCVPLISRTGGLFAGGGASSTD
jgi:hypothetical protein